MFSIKVLLLRGRNILMTNLVAHLVGGEAVTFIVLIHDIAMSHVTCYTRYILKTIW